jgi:hypothetical protein
MRRRGADCLSRRSHLHEVVPTWLARRGGVGLKVGALKRPQCPARTLGHLPPGRCEGLQRVCRRAHEALEADVRDLSSWKKKCGEGDRGRGEKLGLSK